MSEDKYITIPNMKHYQHYTTLNVEQIAEIKDTWGEKVRIAMGVDFGSGSPSQTVIGIIIEWNNF